MVAVRKHMNYRNSNHYGAVNRYRSGSRFVILADGHHGHAREIRTKTSPTANGTRTTPHSGPGGTSQPMAPGATRAGPHFTGQHSTPHL